MSNAERKEQLAAELRKRSAESYLAFLYSLTIDSVTRPKKGQKLNDCIAPFQRKCFEDIAPSIEQLRDGEEPDIRRVWWERTKKASKDGDIGATVLWLIAFARRPFKVTIGAVDRDQAKEIKLRISRILYRNSWLDELVAVHNYEVKNRKRPDLVQCEIVATDIKGGAHGGLPDLLVLNEVTHIGNSWTFVDTMLANADGVPNGMVICASNAGYKGTEAELLMKHARNSDFWYFHALRKPAPWTSKKALKDAREREPSLLEYERLWKGKWIALKGEGLDQDKIDAMLKRRKGPEQGRRKGWRYVAGLDIGVNHDHSGIVVLGANRRRRKIRVAWLRGFEPKPVKGSTRKQVWLPTVKKTCRSVWKKFGVEWFGYDPDQAVMMAQELGAEGCPMVEWRFGAANLGLMANALIQELNNDSIEGYDDAEGRLKRDIGKFMIVKKSYGYRLEATSDVYGHADVGTALVIALPQAVRLMEGWEPMRPDDILAYDSDEPMTDEEIEGLPDEEKEMWEVLEDEQDDFEWADGDWEVVG